MFGIVESASLYTPLALAEHVSQLLSEGAPRKVAVSTAFRLGKWRSDQKKPRAVLVELQTVADKHFKGSQHLRGKKIRLDDDLTPQQMQQRREWSSDFLCLKARGYKPFFRGATLKYRDGAAVKTCTKGEANKVVATAAAQAQAFPMAAARGQATPPRRNAVAIDPTMVLQQASITVLPQPPSMGAVGEGFMLSGSDDGEPLDEEA